jgi:colicin import membrane protein
MSIVELDEKNLVVFQDFERAISGLAEQYLPLKIAGPDDKKGFEAVYAARQDVKKRRIKVEHMRKELRANALEFGRKVDGAAKKLEGLLTPIEAHLESQEAEYNAAKEAIKRKAAEEAAAKLQARVNALTAVGGAVSLAVLQALTDEQFAAELATATKAHEERKAAEEVARIERERQEAEARKQREAEEARIAAERAKLEAERKVQKELARVEREKLEAERRKQEEALAEERRKADEAAAAERAKQAEFARKLEEERRKIAEERQRIEREEFERQAKARAEQEARDKLEAERRQQERKDAEAKAEEARREAMKPDLQRLRDYAAALEAVPIPNVSDDSVYQIVLNMAGEVERMCQRVETWCDEQEAQP